MLDQSFFLEKLTSAVKEFKSQLDFKTSLAYQGFTSLTFTEFSVFLQKYFPSLAPQDFYRFKTINQLIDQFGIDKSADTRLPRLDTHSLLAATPMEAEECLPYLFQKLIDKKI